MAPAPASQFRIRQFKLNSTATLAAQHQADRFCIAPCGVVLQSCIRLATRLPASLIACLCSACVRAPFACLPSLLAQWTSSPVSLSPPDRFYHLTPQPGSLGSFVAHATHRRFQRSEPTAVYCCYAIRQDDCMLHSHESGDGAKGEHWIAISDVCASRRHSKFPCSRADGLGACHDAP